MLHVFSRTEHVWPLITHLGSASLLMPTLALALTDLWHSRQRAAARVWSLALGSAIFLTLLTKILFFGWGIGIAAIDFTGISGHALLATSVLPVLFGYLFASGPGHLRLAGALFGLLIGAGVAISRVVLGAHSISEVVFAWLIGLAVTGVTLHAMADTARRPGLARLAPLVFLLVFCASGANYLPTHDWEVSLALQLSGHGTPYTRQAFLPLE